MKIKKWSSFNESIEDIVNKCFDYIINSGEIDIYQLFDEEVLNWVEDDWEDDWEDEHTHYADIGNGEAEDVVFSDVVAECERKFNIRLNDIELNKLREKINYETGIVGL
jgi:hypothetical protein